MKIPLAFSLLFSSTITLSQTDSTKKLSFFGYIEGYYVKDFNQPSSRK